MELLTRYGAGLAAGVLVLAAATSGQAQLRKAPGARQGRVSGVTAQAAGEQQTETDTAALDAVLARLARWRHADARNRLAGKEDDPRLAAAWGLLLVEEGHAEEGISRLRQAEGTSPADPAPAYWLGEALFIGQDLSGATAAWNEAAARASAILSRQAEDPRASFYLGAAKVRLKAFPEAREALDTAAAGGWDAAMVSYQKGLSHAFAQEWQDAITDLTAAVEADPTYAHAWYYRALSWDKVHRTDRMLQDLERFVQLAPDAPEADRARSILAAAGH